MKSEAKRFQCGNCSSNFESIPRETMSCPMCGSGKVRRIIPIRKQESK